MLQLKEVIRINLDLQSVSKDTVQAQGISELISFGADVMGWLAFTGNQMAEAKRQMNQAALKAHATLREIGAKMPPSLQTDYIKRAISEEEYAFDICERTNRACTHTLDFLRSAISALKAEAYNS